MTANTTEPSRPSEDASAAADRLPATTITSPDGTVTHLIALEQYLALEDESDGYRRACALVNGWRVTPDRGEGELDRILASVGMGAAEGRAVAQLVAQVRSGAFNQPA